jgi:tetratricopeptide (TPR) repeat protein
MYSITANLVAVPASLARFLATVSVRHVASLNALQSRNISNLAALSIRSCVPNYQDHLPLSGRVRPFSSHAYDARLDHSSIQATLSPLVASQEPIPATSIEKTQQKVEKKVYAIHYSSIAREETIAGNFEKAEKYYTLAIQEAGDPGRIALMKAFRGDFYREIGQFDKAIQDLEEAIQEESPSYFFRDSAFNYLAWTYRDKGDPSKAVEVLQKGLKSDPDSLTLRYELGEIYLSTGNAKLALEHLEFVAWYCEDGYYIECPILSKFTPDIIEAVSQLKNCSDGETPAIYTKLQEAKARFPCHPLHAC